MAYGRCAATADFCLMCLILILMIVSMCGVSQDTDTILNTAWGVWSENVPFLGGKLTFAANFWGYAYALEYQLAGYDDEKYSYSWKEAAEDGCSSDMEYFCDMHNAAPALYAMLIIAFIFLGVKFFALLALVSRPSPRSKLTNLLCTFFGWLFLMVCWCHYVNVGVKTVAEYDLIPYFSVDDFTIAISPGPGCGCAISVWVFLMISMILSAAVPSQPDDDYGHHPQELGPPEIFVGAPPPPPGAVLGVGPPPGGPIPVAVGVPIAGAGPPIPVAVPCSRADDRT